MKPNLRFILLSLITALVLQGCGAPKSGGEGQEAAASERGITDNEIVIGSWGPLTGPAAL